jgi:hypothetical protein
LDKVAIKLASNKCMGMEGEEHARIDEDSAMSIYKDG